MIVDSQTTAPPSLSRFAQPHGGALSRAAAAYPDAAKPWVDLSTGINPYPWPWPEPVPLVDDTALTRLPEPDAQAQLEAAATKAYGAQDPAMVVAAPGTQALISLLPLVVPARKAAILGPTYSEHAIAWGQRGRSVDVISDLGALQDHDVIVVVNPNNPDGRVHTPADLITAMRGRGLLVIDEAFADLEGRGISAIPYISQTDTIVLRSFGKTYGLAGLRLGFAVARIDIAQHIRQALGPWAVSGPALQIGTVALRDGGWMARMCGKMGAEASRLDGVLRRAGLEIVGGTRLFRLARTPDAATLFDRLCQFGILTRKFDEHPDLIRFGIPQDAALERLEAALSIVR
jgi:cobalamin biosynthetic protein CobC